MSKCRPGKMLLDEVKLVEETESAETIAVAAKKSPKRANE